MALFTLEASGIISEETTSVLGSDGVQYQAVQILSDGSFVVAVLLLEPHPQVTVHISHFARDLTPLGDAHHTPAFVPTAGGYPELGVSMALIGSDRVLVVMRSTFNPGDSNFHYVSWIYDCSGGTPVLGTHQDTMSGSLASFFPTGLEVGALLPTLGMLFSGDLHLYDVATGLPAVDIQAISPGPVAVAVHAHPTDSSRAAFIRPNGDVVHISGLGGTPAHESTVSLAPTSRPPAVSGGFTVVAANSPYDAHPVVTVIESSPLYGFVSTYALDGSLLSFLAYPSASAVVAQDPVPATQGTLVSAYSNGYLLIGAGLGRTVSYLTAAGSVALPMPSGAGDFTPDTLMFGASAGPLGYSQPPDEIVLVLYKARHDADGLGSTDNIVVAWVLHGEPISGGQTPPLRLAQRDDGLGLSGHARLPVSKQTSSVQASPARVMSKSGYL